MKTNRILVPIDFSELGAKVLKEANHYSDIFNSEIVLLHAFTTDPLLGEYDGLGMSFDFAISQDSMSDSIKARLEELAQEYFSDGKKVTVRVEIGSPSNVICELSPEYDLIFMGTHGRTGVQRFLLGSVAEKVIRCSKTPVILVEQYSNIFPINKIMVTTDFSENSFKAFSFVSEIAKKTKAEVSLVNIRSTDNVGNLDELEDDIDLRKKWMEKIDEMYFSDIKDQIKHEILVSGKSVTKAIFEHNYSRKYNLVVMATQGKGGLKKMVMGSTTAAVVRSIETAVLVVNPYCHV